MGVITGTAAIESVQVMLLESFPVQVRVVMQGNLPDACTKIGEISVERDGNTFKVKVPTVRPADEMCAQVIMPFEETVALDAAGLKAGTYTVDVNGVTETFTLEVDNTLP